MRGGGRIVHSANQLVFVTGVSLKRASEGVQGRLEGDVNGLLHLRPCHPTLDPIAFHSN